jgi:hypothetical protein
MCVCVCVCVGGWVCMPGIYHAMSAAMSIKAVRQPSVQGSGAPPLPCGMRALKRATGGPLKCLRHFSSCRSFLRLLGRAFPWFCMAPRNGLAISILSHSVLGGKESDDNASSVIWSHVTYHMCWVGKNADCKVNRLMHKTNRPCKPPTVPNDPPAAAPRPRMLGRPNLRTSEYFIHVDELTQLIAHPA